MGRVRRVERGAWSSGLGVDGHVEHVERVDGSFEFRVGRWEFKETLLI